MAYTGKTVKQSRVKVMADNKPRKFEKQTFIKDKQIDELKVPPHSLEAEQSVLGGLLLDNET